MPIPDSPTFSFLEAPNWRDYELLDSGEGLKLERFGKYVFVRPEYQAMWPRALQESEWKKADAIFRPTAEESGGHWVLNRKIDEKWMMSYPLTPPPLPKGEGQGVRVLKFWAMTTPGRHLGVFPEVASHWDFIVERVQKADQPKKILNLFGYTGLASLAAAAVGSQVTHVDASKKSISWARANQALSGLDEKPIRWIVDDAVKFVEREGRRGVKYDGIILDPPKFGRGPKGEVWEIYKSLPNLLGMCGSCLSDTPLFVIVTIYAVRASAIHVAQAVDEMMKKHKGTTISGELVTRESSANRLLSQAVYARWQAK